MDQLKGRFDGFDRRGVVLAPRRRQELVTIEFEEILTAERPPTPWGLVLHTRRMGRVVVRCLGRRRQEIEDALRRRGIRIVDEYGAMITPSFQDFLDELDRDPVQLRQSSDDA